MSEANEDHFHEIIDRIHVIICNIDDHLIDHPGMTEEMNELCDIAQYQLNKVAKLAWAEEEKFKESK